MYIVDQKNDMQCITFGPAAFLAIYCQEMIRIWENMQDYVILKSNIKQMNCTVVSSNVHGVNSTFLFSIVNIKIAYYTQQKKYTVNTLGPRIINIII